MGARFFVAHLGLPSDFDGRDADLRLGESLMLLLGLLLSQYRRSALLVLTPSALSAILSIGVVAFLNGLLIPSAAMIGSQWLLFALLLLVLFCASSASNVAMTSLGHRMVYELRRSLVKRVLDTSIEQLERLGSARLLAALINDTSHITKALNVLPFIVYGITLSVAGFAYLAWLSPPLFAVTASWLLLTTVVGVLLLRQTEKHLAIARDGEGRLVSDYQAVVEGRRELRLNRARARRVYEQEFECNAQRVRAHLVRGDSYNVVNENWINTMVLGAVGLSFTVSYGLQWADANVALTYALTVLFLRGPLTSVAVTMASLVQGSVALRSIGALELAEAESAFAPPVPADTKALPVDWRTLRLEELGYSYVSESEPGFSVGPLTLTLRRGEVVFLVGGNGSGKTTFAHLLTGLYRADTGRILLDGTSLSESLRPAYHRLFSTVFSDFQLFRTALGQDGELATEQEVRRWLERFEIAHKVAFTDGRLESSRLSRGQQKRLALTIALLEKRPVLVLDEWAADQDPAFRRTFYREILPELKAAGKTIVAITHDDQYHDAADRVLKMSHGKLRALEPLEAPRARDGTLRRPSTQHSDA